MYESDFGLPDMDATLKIDNPLGDKRLIFKQFIRDGAYVADNGWRVETVREGVSFLDSTHLLKDRDGHILDQIKYWVNEFEERYNWMEFHSYRDRTGRRGEFLDDIKLAPEHFPEGTVFRVALPYGHPMSVHNTTEYRQFIFKATKVIRNGARSYLVETTTPVTKIHNKDELEPYTIHMSHIEKIIQRGNGPMVIDQGYRIDRIPGRWNEKMLQRLKDEGYVLPTPQKGEVIYEDQRYAIVDCLIEQDRWSDSEEVNIRRAGALLRQQGLMRTVVVFPVGYEPMCGDWRRLDFMGQRIVLVRMNALRKWLVKNRHRVMVGLDQMCAEERREDENYARDVLGD